MAATALLHKIPIHNYLYGCQLTVVRWTGGKKCCLYVQVKIHVISVYRTTWKHSPLYSHVHEYLRSHMSPTCYTYHT